MGKKEGEALQAVEHQLHQCELPEHPLHFSRREGRREAHHAAAQPLRVQAQCGGTAAREEIALAVR